MNDEQPAAPTAAAANPSAAPSRPSWLEPWFERARQAGRTLARARGEGSLFLFGVALIWLTGFNDYHGLALSSKLPFLRLDLGFLLIAAGAALFLTRSEPADEAAPPRDTWAWVGAGVLGVGVLSELVCHLSGMFGELVFAGVFAGDALVLAGGALYTWRASSSALPPHRTARWGLALLLAGLVATLAYSFLTRGAFFGTLSAHYAGSTTETVLGGVSATANPSALAAAATSASDTLAAAVRAVHDVGGGRMVVGYLATLALLGLLLLGFAATRARTGGEPRGGRFWAEGGFVVLALGALLYLPTLGAFGFYDPWEGHYAEVARQMVWRDDWVSLFWENNWFWSKPVGIFWMMAVAFKGFGASDFVARLPFALTGLAGMVFVYYFCRRLWTARAGVIAAFVLGTIPQFMFISRQVMTDVPVVVLTIIGVGCLILALFGPDEDDAPRAPLTLLFTVLFAATTLPQYSMVGAELDRHGLTHALLYTLPWIGIVLTMGRARTARHIHAYAFFWSVGLGCLAKGLIAPGLPVLVLFAYLLCSGAWGDLFSMRRLATGFVVSALAFGALMLLVKGIYKIPGTGLVFSSAVASAFAGLLAIGATARGGIWDRLQVGRGLVIFFLTTLPWYVAMAARHGGAQLDGNAIGGFKLSGFLHEFFVQHHFDRLGGGVHGDNATTFEYFVRWGAYALFPWIGLVPGALSRFWAGHREGELESASPAWRASAHAKLFVFLWFAVFFTLFTLSATKFHHYILPALPPLAIMLGVWLDRAADDERELSRPILAGAIAIIIFVGWDLYRTPQTFFNSFTYVFSGRSYPWPTTVMPEAFLRLTMVTLCGLLALALMPRPRWTSPPRKLVWGVGLVFIGLAVALVLEQFAPTSLKLHGLRPDRVGAYRDAIASVMPTPPTTVWSDYMQAPPYDRFWSYARIIGRLADFGFGTLAAFAAVLAAGLLYAVGRRRILMYLFAGVTYVFAFYLANTHMVELGPHSGQRHMWDVYYAKRAGPHEKLCAYMMNWRSEHWYSHNEVIVGLSDPPLLAMARQPGRQWIITERTRVNDVRGLIQDRNNICRGVFQWDTFSNRYTLLSVEDAPDDPKVKACLAKQGAKPAGK